MIFISSFLLSIHSCLMAHGLLLPHSHYQVIPSSSCEFLLIYIHISLLLPLLFFILPSFLSCFLAFFFPPPYHPHPSFPTPLFLPFFSLFCPTCIPLSNPFSYLTDTDSCYVRCTYSFRHGLGFTDRSRTNRGSSHPIQ